MNYFNPSYIRMLKNGNPKQMVLNIVKQNSSNNQMMANILSMIESGNANGLQSFVRNVCKERGLDADELLNQINKM